MDNIGLTLRGSIYKGIFFPIAYNIVLYNPWLVESAHAGADLEEPCIGMQVKKQQLELYMEQLTGSKLGKEYIKAVYCHPAYLVSMQIT